uniref:Uncharacterized protein n=1 Tax=Picea sitchensis TaxID=3332 RepID=A0A6B9XXB3_PICSI|nr:hypothetical protein Q903MT_gene6828 [Picea sitchensis]
MLVRLYLSHAYLSLPLFVCKTLEDRFQCSCSPLLRVSVLPSACSSAKVRLLANPSHFPNIDDAWRCI